MIFHQIEKRLEGMYTKRNLKKMLLITFMLSGFVQFGLLKFVPQGIVNAGYSKTEIFLLAMTVSFTISFMFAFGYCFIFPVREKKTKIKISTF